MNIVVPLKTTLLTHLDLKLDDDFSYNHSLRVFENSIFLSSFFEIGLNRDLQGTFKTDKGWKKTNFKSECVKRSFLKSKMIIVKTVTFQSMVVLQKFDYFKTMKQFEFILVNSNLSECPHRWSTFQTELF